MLPKINVTVTPIYERDINTQPVKIKFMMTNENAPTLLRNQQKNCTLGNIVSMVLTTHNT